MPSVEVTASTASPSQRDEADGEIEPQHDLAADLPEIELLVGDVEHDVRGGIDEGADADHAAHVEQLAEARRSRRSGVTASEIIRNISAQ